eukprot:gnl/TRDRNA2_/TRDRNA2_76113_c0_seq1.p1 gnl/TRDRNA2_/TRDRNA2_76113_c0~~gnl/TRDRNA2_/TRDRNA2_76113_c0_seq1.p1  ORF type:complete len:358 (-),score=52.46 gnl/TRDRNA2_/TRDRNA2_76113_c0_seq1:55-1128(-)
MAWFLISTKHFLRPSKLAVRPITVGIAQSKLQDQYLERGFPDFSKPEQRIDRIAAKEFSHERSDALNIATKKISALIKMRKYQEALDIFGEAEERDGILYNGALSACAKSVRYNDASQIWSAMPADWKTVVSYNTMIDLCRRGKRGDQAEELFAEMQAAGVQPNIITYTSMIGVYGMSEQPEKAVQTFESIRETFVAKASDFSKQMIYLAVMSSLARMGDYARTREFFIMMTETGVKPDQTHFNALMASCAKGAHGDIAQGIFDIMPQWDVKRQPEDYSILIACNRYNLPRCKEIQATIKEAGLRPNKMGYQNLFEAHVLGGDGSGARALLEEAGSVLDTSSSKMRDLIEQLEKLPA